MNMNWHFRVVVALLLARIPTIHALSAVQVINDGVPGQNSAEIDNRAQEDLKRFNQRLSCSSLERTIPTMIANF